MVSTVTDDGSAARRFARHLAGVALLVGGAVVGYAAPARAQEEAVLAATATPSTGLVDGQTVTVAATGFPESTPGGVLLCVGSVVDHVDEINEQGAELATEYCEAGEYVSGVFTGGADYVVADNLPSFDPFPYSCATSADGCALLVGGFVESNFVVVAVPISFAVDSVPVADAGADKTVNSNTAFTLNAGASTGDAPLTYAWTVVEGEATIRDPESASTVVDPVRGPATLRFRVTVTDDNGDTATDDVIVTVKAPK